LEFIGEVTGVRRRLIDNANASSQFGASATEYEIVSDLDIWVTGHESYNSKGIRIWIPGKFEIGAKFKLTIEPE
jgi:hypothetical protein